MPEYYGDIVAVITTDAGIVSMTEKDCRVRIDRPRNVKYHRLIFAMLGYTIKYMRPVPTINSAEKLLYLFKDVNGFYQDISTGKRSIRIYDSFSFATMDEIEFRPIAEELKKFCYSILNVHKCPQKVIQGLLNIEFDNRIQLDNQ
jgi:hypothetical protein